MKLVRMPVSTVFPLNDYIKFILQIRLIQEGYSFLSGGCLRPAGKDFGLIISSSGGMGKTSAVLNLLRKEGGEFYSDDSIIVSKDRVFAYPAPLRIRKFGSPVLSYNKDTPFEEIMPGTAVASNPVCPRYIFFLERSDKDGLIKVDSDSAFNRIIAINRKTIPYLVERSILAYFYSSYSTGLYDVLEKERSIFKQLLHNVICYAVRVPHPDRYVQMISEIIKKGT